MSDLAAQLKAMRATRPANSDKAVGAQPTAQAQAAVAAAQAAESQAAPATTAPAIAASVPAEPTSKPAVSVATPEPTAVEHLPPNFIGGPYHGHTMSAAPSAGTPQEPAAKADVSPAATAAPGDATKSETPAQVFKIGDKTFTDSAEALAYAQDIQAKLAAQEAYNKGAADVAAQLLTAKEPQPEPVDLTTLLFEDPAKALEIITASIERKVQSKFDARDKAAQEVAANQRAWTSFMDANPRLADYPEIVQMKYAEVLAEKGPNYDAAKGLELVAQRSLQYLDRMAAKLGTTETLSNAAPTQTAPQTLASVPAPKQSPKVVSFTDQVRSAHKR